MQHHANMPTDMHVVQSAFSPAHYAAIDLGSNSFHMVIAKRDLGQVQIIDRIRETVQLAAGFNKNLELSPATQKRALECLRRFRERLSGMPSDHIRVVGTSALREAKNARKFLEKAQEALGQQIDILPGTEEARLIYEGVVPDIANTDKPHLLVDIGGGSTECIFHDAQGLHVESFRMGCVTFSKKYFAEGLLRSEYFEQAELHAASMLSASHLAKMFRSAHLWIGSSGTIEAVYDIALQHNLALDKITPESLLTLKKMMIEQRKVKHLKFNGLTQDRVHVFAGGVAILSALFGVYRIEHMHVSHRALREGVLHELTGHLSHQATCESSVQRLSERYGVDIEHAKRVQHTALHVLNAVASLWKLPVDLSHRFLSRAARLHEIGIALSHRGYHKHSAYLVAHSDMPGFARQEQEALALLIQSHRKKFDVTLFHGLSHVYQELLPKLAVILRLAVCLNRSRQPEAIEQIHYDIRKNALCVLLPRSFKTHYPLTYFDLKAEEKIFECCLA